MINVEKGLGLKNMPGLVKKEICGIFETKNQNKKVKKLKNLQMILNISMLVVISWKK